MELQEVLEKRDKYLDKYEGCLIGGAAGDALGYAVEFDKLYVIHKKYGANGITSYETSIISDDTQMTLFTANGLLLGDTRMMQRGIGAAPHDYVYFAYLDWLKTQGYKSPKEHHYTWLFDIPELHARRAPGTTCLSALASGKCGSIKEPLNTSCGCGGVMRTAPMGLMYEAIDPQDVILEGAEIAAITHGHSLGYIPAGMLSLIVHLAVFEPQPLRDIIEAALFETKCTFEQDHHWDKFEALIRHAITLSENDKADTENIPELGEGWTGHEALAVAVYCSLRHEHDFSKAIIAAINHDGDSDSTGAITGNILGAHLGMKAIDSKWTDRLELKDVILEIARDLCDGCQSDMYCPDFEWDRKYVEMKAPEKFLRK